jgi:hypothetical protein
MTAPNVGGGGGAAGIIQMINLVLNPSSATNIEKQIQTALGKATNPAPAVANFLKIEAQMQRLVAAASRLQNVFAAAFAVKAIANLSGEMFKLGAAVGETEQKFNQVFGDEGSAKMDTFLGKWATLMGLSRQQGRDMASVAGAVSEGMGMTRKQAEEMSQTILKVAGDITSFHNETDPKRAFDAVIGGLTGMRRMLRDYGIVIYEQDVKMRALTNTHKAHAAELTHEERAIASLQLIQEKMGAATGDLERTQMSAANRARAMQAVFRNVRDEIAVSLLPGFVALTNAIMKNQGAVSGLADLVGDALRAAFRGTLTIMAGALEALKLWNEGIAMSAKLGISVRGLFGMDVDQYKRELKEAEDAIKSYTDAIDILKKGYDGLATKGKNTFAMGGGPVNLPKSSEDTLETGSKNRRGEVKSSDELQEEFVRKDIELFQRRIQAARGMLDQDATREEGMKRMAETEKELQEYMDRMNLTWEQRGEILREQTTGQNDVINMYRRQIDAAKGMTEIEGYRTEGLARLIDLQSELDDLMNDSNLTWEQRGEILKTQAQLQDALIDGLKEMAAQYGITQDVIDAAMKGNWKAVAQGIGKEATFRAAWNVAKAIEETAQAFGWFGLGNAAGAAAAKASAAEHWLAAAKWGALAGGATAAVNAAGAGGGAAGGALGNDAASATQTPGAQVTIYVDGFDPKSAKQQAWLAYANEDIRQRYGDNSRVTVLAGSVPR